MTNIFDTHAHYSSRQFDADRDAVMRALGEGGVVGVLECATHSGDAAAVLELARSKMPVHTKDLAISGHDVLVLLEDKSKIRDAMRYLLQRVQSTNLPNERSALEEAVRGWQKRH